MSFTEQLTLFAVSIICFLRLTIVFVKFAFIRIYCYSRLKEVLFNCCTWSSVVK